MKKFNQLLQESVGESTIEKLLWPDGIYGNDRDLAIANLHLVNRVEYPVEQKEGPDFPFKDTSIQHRMGYIGRAADATSDHPAPANQRMSVEQIEELLATELSEEQKTKRAHAFTELKQNLPEDFEDHYGKDSAKALYAYATKLALTEATLEESKVYTACVVHKKVPYGYKILASSPETARSMAVKKHLKKHPEHSPEDVKGGLVMPLHEEKTLSYFFEDVKKTGGSDTEVTPKDEASALAIAKKYDSLAGSTDDKDLAESYGKAAQRFYDTANRLRAFKKRRTGEPKQRLKESEFDDLVAMLEHVISTGDDYVLQLDEEGNETLEITPEQAGVLYNKINAFEDEEAQVAFIDNITESKETLEEAFKE
jgi:hypothetical protein